MCYNLKMIIDSHTHIGKLPNSSQFNNYKQSLIELLKEAKTSGVDHMLIIAGFNKKNNSNTSTKNLIGLAMNKPGVSVVGSIDILNYKKKDIDELRWWFKKKLIVGVKLYTGYQHFYPNDKRCIPIYKLCIEYDTPVVFHSGDTLVGYTKNPKIKYSHPIHVDEIASDYPNLKIVIAHTGNPWLIDCAEVLYKNKNVYADISGLVVAGDDLNTPYGRLMKKRIIELIDYVGENKLLYGTDWPLCPMKTYINFTRNLKLPKKELDRLFYKNTAELFNLKI